MIPFKHRSNNFEFLKPPGMTDAQCGPASVTKTEYSDGTPVILFYWMPTEEELAALNSRHPVCLHIVGTGMPPVYVGVE